MDVSVSSDGSRNMESTLFLKKMTSAKPFYSR